MPDTPAEQHGGGHIDIDIALITESIRQADTPPRALPTTDRIDGLRGRLRGHLGLLLSEDLGPDDPQLSALRWQAETLLDTDTTAAPRSAAWRHTRMLAQLTRDLLTRYKQG